GFSLYLRSSDGEVLHGDPRLRWIGRRRRTWHDVGKAEQPPAPPPQSVPGAPGTCEVQWARAWQEGIDMVIDGERARGWTDRLVTLFTPALADVLDRLG